MDEMRTGVGAFRCDCDDAVAVVVAADNKGEVIAAGD